MYDEPLHAAQAVLHDPRWTTGTIFFARLLPCEDNPDMVLLEVYDHPNLCQANCIFAGTYRSHAAARAAIPETAHPLILVVSSSPL